MASYFLGIDSSTQGCKIVCINTNNSSIEFVDSINYDTHLPEYNTENGVIRTSEPGLSEADPNMWLDAVEILFKRVSDNAFPMKRIKAISVSAQQHGLVALDSIGELSRNKSKLWNDYSTTGECEKLTESIGGAEKMIREIGNTQRPGYTAGKIFHMFRNEPETAQRTSTFFLVHNYINWYLTGGKNGGVRVMEPGDVSGMALMYPGKRAWSKKVCEIISPGLIQKLPPVKRSDRMIGTISIDLAARYGFSKRCLIDAGCGDNMYGAVGTGNIKPGTVTISLGTSGTAYTIFDEPYIDPIGEIASFCDSTGKFMPLLCVSNMANGYDDILARHKINHDGFNEILKQTPAGNKGRILFPWFMGERTPDIPEAVPVYWGFGIDDFTLPVMCRAVLEGHVLNLYEGFKRMPVESTEIRLTGGLIKSDAWCQTIADVFNCETVPIEGEGAALGAAIHSAWVYMKRKDKEFPIEELTDSYVQVDESRRMTPSNAEIYTTMSKIYGEISHRLRMQTKNPNPFKMASEL